MTPMVDVIFQLLTFLLLTYQPTPSEVDVPKARHGIGVERERAVVLTIEPAANAADEVTVRTTDPTGATLRLDTPEAIRAAVAAGVGEDRRRVVLEADGAVPHGAILRIASAVAEVEGVMLHIGVEEP
jgi:biopolymer transport protein ExbD